jgi:hypothetical protein
MGEQVTQDISQISEEESDIIASPFTEDVLEEISQWIIIKLSDQTGFPLNFIQIHGASLKMI